MYLYSVFSFLLSWTCMPRLWKISASFRVGFGLWSVPMKASCGSLRRLYAVHLLFPPFAAFLSFLSILENSKQIDLPSVFLSTDESGCVIFTEQVGWRARYAILSLSTSRCLFTRMSSSVSVYGFSCRRRPARDSSIECISLCFSKKESLFLRSLRGRIRLTPRCRHQSVMAACTDSLGGGILNGCKDPVLLLSSLLLPSSSTAMSVRGRPWWLVGRRCIPVSPGDRPSHSSLSDSEELLVDWPGDVEREPARDVLLEVIPAAAVDVVIGKPRDWTVECRLVGRLGDRLVGRLVDRLPMAAEAPF